MNPPLGGGPPRKRKAAPRRKVAKVPAKAAKIPARPARVGVNKQVPLEAMRSTPIVRRPGGRRPPTPSPVESGFSPMTVFLLVVAAGLLICMAMVLMPKDLKHIDGYPAELSAEDPRNLLSELQAALDPKNADASVTFSEAEVNQYLNQRIRGVQEGVLSSLVKYEGIYVDVEPEFIELYLVRTVAGMPFTVSCRVTQRTSGYQTIWKTGGGSIGRIRMGSRQFKPIVEAFLRLRKVGKDEMSAILAMNKIEYGYDEITFSK